jgi:arylsulfatase A-like enzyme
MLPSLFHDRGYVTTYHGKWHLGDVARHDCFNWNPDLYHFYVDHGKYIRKHNKEHPVTAEAGQTELYGWPVYMTNACRRAHSKWKAQAQDISIIGRMALPLELDKTSWMTDRLLSDLDTYGQRPFMMTWSACPPHAYWAAQEPYYSAIDPAKIELPANMHRPAYQDKCVSSRLHDALGPAGVREYLRCYYGMVNLVDDQIGRILKKLEQIGQLDNTLICFVSDHGDMNAAHSAVGKSIQAFYDEIVRVPMIMWFPKAFRGPRRVKSFVSGVDIMPTILDYCGIAPPAQCQGRSLRPLIEGREQPDRVAFCERTHPTAQSVARLIRTREWRLSVTFENWSTNKGRFKHRWHPELFHLTEDPGEERNLGADPAFSKVRKHLAERMEAWMRHTRDPWAAKLPALV